MGGGQRPQEEAVRVAGVLTFDQMERLGEQP